jgi:toxin YoeB
VTPWQVVFSKQAQKIAAVSIPKGLRRKAEELLTILAIDPLRKPPLEKLLGDVRGGPDNIILDLRYVTRYGSE